MQEIPEPVGDEMRPRNIDPLGDMRMMPGNDRRPRTRRRVP